MAEMTKEDWHKLAKKRKVYKVIGRMVGDLSYAEVGDCFLSDILYERGYNITNLVNGNVIKLVPTISPFEKKILGKNIHSVRSWCPDCFAWGINMPLDKECGSCGYPKTITYYDAETIQNYIDK